MRVQTGQLEALVWIARLGSFRAAAARLGVTQPSISMRIRELERVLDITVFERVRNRAVLTEGGRALVATAERIVSLAEQMEREGTRRPLQHGPIRFGAADTFALTCLPLFLSRVEQLVPDLRVQLQIDYSANLNARLQRGELDMAVLTGPVASMTNNGAPIAAEHLAHLPLAWVGSPRLALPTDRPLLPADLRSYTILTNPPPSHLWTMIVAWFGQGGVPDRIATCNSLTVITRLAASGFGVALLPICILGEELRSGALRTWRTKPAAGGHDLLLAYRNFGSSAMMQAVRNAVFAATQDARLLPDRRRP